jgi:hypothetical protein
MVSASATPAITKAVFPSASLRLTLFGRMFICFLLKGYPVVSARPFESLRDRASLAETTG